MLKSAKIGSLVIFAFGALMAAGYAHAGPPAPSAAATASADNEDAGSPQMQPSEEQMRFAREYVKAVNSRDLKALRRLIPPKTLACFNERNEVYLTTWLERQFADPIAEPYTVTVEKDEPDQLPRSALFTLPVVPTHQINITTKIGGEEVVLGRPIAYQDGRWYETAPCPTDVGMRNFLRKREIAKSKSARADALYAKLKDPLKSDLKKLIQQDKRQEACRRYATAAKVDIQTGCAVVKRLAAESSPPGG